MRKAIVTIPAVCTNLGSGIDSLGLALALHNTVHMQARDDAALSIRGGYPSTAEHPVVRGAAALFKVAERPMPGLDVVCESEIPSESGLGDFAVWFVGGMFAANNLLDKPMPRADIGTLAGSLAPRPVEIETAMLGSLSITVTTGGKTISRRIELTTALKVVLAIPIVANYVQAARQVKASLAPISAADLSLSVGRTALTVEMLRKGELAALDTVMADHLREPKLRALIPGADEAVQAGRQAGAAGATLSGDGPALVFFAKADHDAIETAVANAFRAAGTYVQTWIVAIDTQGVAINAFR